MTKEQLSTYLSSAYGVATQPIMINGVVSKANGSFNSVKPVWTAQYDSLEKLGRAVKNDSELGEWQETYDGGYYANLR